MNEKNVKTKEMLESTVADSSAVDFSELPKDAESSAETVAIVEGNAIFTGLYLERKRYLHEGKERFYCFVGGTLRGRNVEAGMVPKDFAGYDVLDIVFGEDDKVGLYKIPYEMRDEVTKKVMRGFTYKAMSRDEDGVYSIGVKCARDSDKAILEMLLKTAEREAKN